MPDLDDEMFEGGDAGDEQDSAGLDDGEGAGGEPQLSLYAGKYKSAEELEKAYLEAQQALTAKAQEAAELRRFVAQTAPSQTTAPPEGTPEWEEYWNAKFYESPARAMNEYSQQATQQVSAGRRAITQALAERAGDPMFQVVADDYRQALESVDERIMADPQQAAAAAEMLYDSVIGRAVRQQRGGSRATQQQPEQPRGFFPAQRQQMLQQMGVSQPQPGADGGPQMSQGQRNLLSELGITGKQARTVYERAQRRLEEQE